MSRRVDLAAVAEKSRWVDLNARAKKSSRVDRCQLRSLDRLTWIPEPRCLDRLT